MEMQQLQHFLAIARLSSVGRAADELNISQSGLSRSLRSLENALGLPLFEREPRGVRLTEFGENLRTRASVIVAEHDRALAEARSFRALNSGDVTLGLHGVFSQLDAVDVLDRFLTAHPTVNISIVTGADPDLSNRVATSELDLAFTLFAGERRDGALIYEDLFGLNCGIYCRQDHPATTLAAPVLADLSPQLWGLGGALAFRQVVEAAFVDQGVAVPRRLLQCSSLKLLIDLVLRRDMLTILPDRLAASLAGQLVRLNLTAPGGSPRGGLIYRAESLQQPSIRVIAAQFRAFGILFDSTTRR